MLDRARLLHHSCSLEKLKKPLRSLLDVVFRLETSLRTSEKTVLLLMIDTLCILVEQAEMGVRAGESVLVHETLDQMDISLAAYSSSVNEFESMLDRSECDNSMGKQAVRKIRKLLDLIASRFSEGLLGFWTPERHFRLPVSVRSRIFSWLCVCTLPEIRRYIPRDLRILICAFIATK